MKALILAGGFGTRLRPLSCTRPKLLFPIANRPLLDLTLQRLAENGVKEVILAVNFMADRLRQTYGDSKNGVKLYYSEDTPQRLISAPQRSLGTGGPIKQAERMLGKSGPFFVLNGDILTSANYSDILEKHRSNEGVATIALHMVEDPSRYGVAELAEEGRINRFVEKPRKKAPSKLVNAGIYVLEPDIFDYIPPRKRCSIEREVFPRLAEERKLFGCEIKSLWIDVGKPADYIEANKLWLKAGMERSSYCEPEGIGEKAYIKDPVAVGSGTTVGKGSTIGPNVSLGEGVAIGREVDIKDSIIFPHTVVSDLTAISGAVVGELVKIGENVRIPEGCLIGDNSIIRDNVTLARNVKICPSKEISASILAPGCIT